MTRPIELPRVTVPPVVPRPGGSAAAQLVARLEEQLHDAPQAKAVDVRA